MQRQLFVKPESEAGRAMTLFPFVGREAPDTKAFWGPVYYPRPDAAEWISFS